MKVKFAAVAALSSVLLAGQAFAQAEVHINDAECQFFDMNNVLITVVPPALGGGGIIQRVHTASGNAKVTCTGFLPDGAAGPTDKAFMRSDFGCMIGSEVTYDSHLIFTKSGRFALTCHYKVSD